jgi:hypothetical protein
MDESCFGKIMENQPTIEKHDNAYKSGCDNSGRYSPSLQWHGFLEDLFQQSQLILESIPIPPPDHDRRRRTHLWFHPFHFSSACSLPMSVFHKTRLEHLEPLAIDLRPGQVGTIENDVSSRDYWSEANASRSNTLPCN